MTVHVCIYQLGMMTSWEWTASNDKMLKFVFSLADGEAKWDTVFDVSFFAIFTDIFATFQRIKSNKESECWTVGIVDNFILTTVRWITNQNSADST